MAEAKAIGEDYLQLEKYANLNYMVRTGCFFWARGGGGVSGAKAIREGSWCGLGALKAATCDSDKTGVINSSAVRRLWNRCSPSPFDLRQAPSMSPP
jgi:hypothetical protein